MKENVHALLFVEHRRGGLWGKGIGSIYGKGVVMKKI